MIFLDRTNSTPQVNEVLTLVDFEMKLLRHNTQTPAHVVLALLVRADANPASRLLAQYTTDLVTARKFVRAAQEPQTAEIALVYFSDSMKNVFERALIIARQSEVPNQPVRSTHLLQAIIEELDPETDKLFNKLGVYPWHLYRDLKNHDTTDD
ncbi:hypothetical protein BH10PAT4_BH10PAT4_4130 [soil metagenome]